MKPRTMMLLAVALGCGLVAMLGVRQAMSNKTVEEEEVDQVEVLVATADIPAFTKLDDTNCHFKTMRADSAPEGAVSSWEHVEERVIKIGAVTGDTILKTKLSERGMTTASVEIPDGYRIHSVKVNATKTHSGLISPGDYVDVSVTYQALHETRGVIKRTQMILQRCKVFAADNVRRKNSDGTEINAKNISLVVTPDQLALLTLAESKGDVTLALRSPNDTKMVDVAKIDETMLDGNFNNQKNGKDPEPVDPEPVRQPTVVYQPPVEVKPEPKPNTWKMTIFEGYSPRVEEIVLPDEPTAQR